MWPVAEDVPPSVTSVGAGGRLQPEGSVWGALRECFEE